MARRCGFTRRIASRSATTRCATRSRGRSRRWCRPASRTGIPLAISFSTRTPPRSCGRSAPVARRGRLLSRVDARRRQRPRRAISDAGLTARSSRARPGAGEESGVGARAARRDAPRRVRRPHGRGAGVTLDARGGAIAEAARGPRETCGASEHSLDATAGAHDPRTRPSVACPTSPLETASAGTESRTNRSRQRGRRVGYRLVVASLRLSADRRLSLIHHDIMTRSHITSHIHHPRDISIGVIQGTFLLVLDRN